MNETVKVIRFYKTGGIGCAKDRRNPAIAIKGE